MSTEYPKISIKLQELVNQANNNFPSTGEVIMVAFNQALTEGYTPRQAKNILYNNIHFLNERTIRRYLPLEAKDTEKIRTRSPIEANGLQKSAEKDHSIIYQGSNYGEVTGTINREEDIAPDLGIENILSFSMTIMKLENILKNKDKYVIELLERNEELNIENRKLKEEKKSQINNQETNLSGEVLKVKAPISLLYKDVLSLRQTISFHVNIIISKGKYIGLEPI